MATWMTQAPRMGSTHAPPSVNVSGLSAGTIPPTISNGRQWKELHSSIPSQEFAGSVSVRSNTSSMTQMMPLSTKDLISSQNVGTMTSIVWQTLESLFKKLFLHFHFPLNMQEQTPLGFPLQLYYLLFFHLCYSIYCYVCNWTLFFAKWQIFKATTLDQTNWRESTWFEMISLSILIYESWCKGEIYHCEIVRGMKAEKFYIMAVEKCSGKVGNTYYYVFDTLLYFGCAWGLCAKIIDVFRSNTLIIYRLLCLYISTSLSCYSSEINTSIWCEDICH